MNQYVRLPDPLCNTGDVVQNWREWKNDFVVFMKASNNINAPMETKVFLLKNYIGKFGQNIIERIMSKNVKCRNNMDMLLSELDNHFDPPKTEVTERYNFFTAQKGRKQSFNDYIDYLKEKAANCNFGTMRDSLIRDKIIAELKDEQLIKKLISVENLHLSTLVSICSSHALEVGKKKQALLANKVNKSIPNVECKKYTHPENRRKGNQNHPAWFNEYKCPTMIFEKREEGKNEAMQQANLQGPSAPPLFAIGNATDNKTLYPSLNDIKVVEDERSAMSWSWYKEHNTKFAENVQKSSRTFQEGETEAPSNNVIDVIKRYMKR